MGLQQGQFERRPVKQEELSWLSRPRALRNKKDWPPKNGHWQTIKCFGKKAFLTLSPKRVKDCQAAVYCGFSNFWQKVADLPFFFYLLAS